VSVARALQCAAGMTIVTPEQMRAAREPTHAVDPALNPKHPHSGLSVEETDLLEREGWLEIVSESVPPPWGCRGGGARWSPRDALAACRLAVARRLLSAEVASLRRFLGDPNDTMDLPIDPSPLEAIVGSPNLAGRFAPAYLAAVLAALNAYAVRDYAKVIALMEGVARAPAPVAPPLDLDAVLREISTKGVEVRFRPEGDVSVYRIDSDKALVGTGPTVDTAVRDLAGQSLALRKRERDGLCGSLDAATKRHDTLASLLGDAAKTPTC